MKIVIDRQSIKGKKTGYGFYLDNLLKELVPLAREHELVYIDKVKENLNTPKRIWWDQIKLPRAAKKAKADLLWAPSFSCPIFYQGKKIVTAHDLIGMIFPENFSLASKFYWKKLLPYSFTRADHVITVSENSKKDLMRLLNIPEEKITVTPEGYSDFLKPLAREEAKKKVADAFDIHEPFILSVSTIEPRKNYARLIKAFAFAKRKDEILVIVGKKAWGFEDLLELVNKYNLQGRVKFLDYVANEDLNNLYNACRFFVLVSLYEGFGLTPLEAMACGAPVLVSNTSSLPEVVGEAGMLVDPKNIEKIGNKMNILLENENLINEMREKSLAQAKKFSWSITAQKTMDVFNKVLKKDT
ncbi:glycosyltransferase family 4 protein [Patescibacteria group bacterium]|nr:glycosyltransferase family 4 protein [Patescibacteria group bacterium]MBU1673195.1 glycosyltransferase family 4 protein [Patescibacteria group bacterium]MBU1963025.1 glycosyltransferase family 4 protein [Patescibacteria group bacterium]